jgi:hypothetical protein
MPIRRFPFLPTLVRFGHGDVQISIGAHDDDVCDQSLVFFEDGTRGRIGGRIAVLGERKMLREMNARKTIVLRFDHPATIDTLLDALFTIKRQMYDARDEWPRLDTEE